VATFYIPEKLYENPIFYLAIFDFLSQPTSQRKRNVAEARTWRQNL